MIPVNEPIVSQKAKKYVNQALDSGWISSAGSFIDDFETQFAKYLGVRYASTASNGTTALHLALLALGIGKGDEVIIPDLTIISCALAAVYVGAKPVLVDVESTTGNIDPQKIEAAITPNTKAIMVVHLYGQPCDMGPIMEIAHKHGLLLIEDAAEAHGAEYKGKKVGSFGDIAIFSFYANKILTTGEGGMVVTNHQKYIKKVNLFKNLANSAEKRFWHEEVGFNYRFTNIQAAMGLAHLEEIDTFIGIKRKMRQTYDSLLSDIPYIQLPQESRDTFNVFWMYNILLTEDSPINRDMFMLKLKQLGVDTRSYFYPLHEQPVLSNFKYQANDLAVSKSLSYRGLYLPSGLTLTTDQIAKVSEAIHDIFKQ